jgi:F0F1-type ATP synthase membrane subunit c/vacuolar-type H+-ATPase subunit K
MSYFTPRPYNRSLLPNARRRLRKKKLRRTYELGAVAVGDSAAAGGLVAAGVAAGSVVSVFCSHAARSAAPARIQMYFFIVLIEGTLVQSKNRSKAVFPGWKLRCV